MKHSAPDFTEIDREEIAPLCQNLATRNAPWHIHALHPNCRFNSKPEGYCFVVEDTDAKRVWRCFSSNPFIDECRELVQVLHGATILNDKERDPNFTPPKILRAVHDCVSADEKWHHHIMIPGCIFSPEPLHHVVTLERESSAKIEIHVSQQPPDNLQREIELLYFKQNVCC